MSPRMAANNPAYTFLLRNDLTGKVVEDVRIELPSSTTIIKQTLAAPELVGWAYRQTRDSISGLVATTLESPAEIVDVLSDADMLEEVLKENRMRPSDVRDERAEEGRDRHDLFEKLGKAALLDDETDVRIATKMAESKDGWERAIADWWLTTAPNVVAPEHTVPCPRHGFCGTLDLIWQDIVRLTPLTITDLKTRKADGEVYTSDLYQGDSYKTAWNLLHPSDPVSRTTVLVARKDGTWIEEESRLPGGSFLKLLEVWQINQGLKKKKL